MGINGPTARGWRLGLDLFGSAMAAGSRRISRARTRGTAVAGDAETFCQLVDPYRRELQVHCDRILGLVQDAEDALQETLLTA